MAKKESKCCKMHAKCGGAIYALGLIGAAIYYISIATSVGMKVLGFLKAIVWPVFVVWGLLKFLGV